MRNGIGNAIDTVSSPFQKAFTYVSDRRKEKQQAKNEALANTVIDSRKNMHGMLKKIKNFAAIAAFLSIMKIINPAIDIFNAEVIDRINLLSYEAKYGKIWDYKNTDDTEKRLDRQSRKRQEKSILKGHYPKYQNGLAYLYEKCRRHPLVLTGPQNKKIIDKYFTPDQFNEKGTEVKFGGHVFSVVRTRGTENGKSEFFYHIVKKSDRKNGTMAFYSGNNMRRALLDLAFESRTVQLIKSAKQNSQAANQSNNQTVNQSNNQTAYNTVADSK